MGNVYKGKKSKEEIKRIQELRRSNSATPQDSKNKRSKSRGDNKRKSLKDWI
jgi:hypothetical protein